MDKTAGAKNALSGRVSSKVRCVAGVSEESYPLLNDDHRHVGTRGVADGHALDGRADEIADPHETVLD